MAETTTSPTHADVAAVEAVWEALRAYLTETDPEFVDSMPSKRLSALGLTLDQASDWRWAKTQQARLDWIAAAPGAALIDIDLGVALEGAPREVHTDVVYFRVGGCLRRDAATRRWHLTLPVAGSPNGSRRYVGAEAAEQVAGVDGGIGEGLVV